MTGDPNRPISCQLSAPKRPTGDQSRQVGGLFPADFEGIFVLHLDQRRKCDTPLQCRSC